MKIWGDDSFMEKINEKVINKIDILLYKYTLEKEETPWYHNTANCILKGKLSELKNLRKELDENKLRVYDDDVICTIGGRIKALEKLKKELMEQRRKERNAE